MFQFGYAILNDIPIFHHRCHYHPPPFLPGLAHLHGITVASAITCSPYHPTPAATSISFDSTRTHFHFPTPYNASHRLSVHALTASASPLPLMPLLPPYGWSCDCRSTHLMSEATDRETVPPLELPRTCICRLRRRHPIAVGTASAHPPTAYPWYRGLRLVLDQWHPTFPHCATLYPHHPRCQTRSFLHSRPFCIHPRAHVDEFSPGFRACRPVVTVLLAIHNDSCYYIVR